MAGPRLRILISGSTGLLGSALIRHFVQTGHTVVRLVRGESRSPESIRWDPLARSIETSRLEGLDAVVHLAGENIADSRWTAAKKQRVYDSRVHGTRYLCETLAALKRPPRVLISASGSGYYGNGGEVVLTEESPLGAGFMAEVCRDWEAATQTATAAGIRVVNARTGMVLTPAGGALGKMLPAFHWGFGVVIGPGQQHFGWISLVDYVGAVSHGLVTEDLRGPVNFVAPQAVTQREFARTLGRVLRRPVWMTLPPPFLRAAFGPDLTESMLWDQRIAPARLERAGYTFRHPTLEAALRDLLARPA
jgi:uncharacterized protein (TIGR01777 family)